MNYLVTPARPEERQAALRLYFQHAGEAERESHVERVLTHIAHGEFPPEGLLICRAGRTLVGAITATPLAGAAGLVWPPQTVSAPPMADVEDLLVNGALSWLRQSGAKFAEALLTTAETPFAAPLERHGFRRITTLLHLKRNLSAAACPEDAEPELRYEGPTASDSALFNKTLLASYEESLDCPELNELRTIEEILAGYRAMPGCRLDCWWLALAGDRAVGVLILVPVDSATWELAYVGLPPAARRQGFGRAMTCRAMTQTLSAGGRRLTLTVDVRNQPARRLYESMGFEEFDRREVYLTVFGNR